MLSALLYIIISGIELLSNCIKNCIMKKLTIFSMCIFALFSSCSKDENPETLNTDQIERRTLTPEEILLKEKLASTAQIVRDVILTQPKVVKEVSDLISLKKYRDDYIYFKDLFRTYKKGSDLQPTLFERTFNEIMERKSNIEPFHGLKEFLVESDITLYCPYPVEDYPVENQMPSCTSDPIDNDQVNTGYQIMSDGSYLEVDVDEKYSEKYPVWIVMPEDEDIETGTAAGTGKGTVHQMRVGYARSSIQYDGFFSGGSEFKFCLLGGTITSTSATTFSGLQTCYLTRSQIRQDTWVRFQYELDDDWYVSVDGTTDEGGRQFGLIEFDKNKTTFTLTFEPKVKIDKIELSAGKVELKIESAEGWIKLDNYMNRDNFIRLNNTDMGNGLKDGYRVFAAGGVKWTLPVLEY